MASVLELKRLLVFQKWQPILSFYNLQKGFAIFSKRKENSWNDIMAVLYIFTAPQIDNFALCWEFYFDKKYFFNIQLQNCQHETDWFFVLS